MSRQAPAILRRVFPARRDPAKNSTDRARSGIFTNVPSVPLELEGLAESIAVAIVGATQAAAHNNSGAERGNNSARRPARRGDRGAGRLGVTMPSEQAGINCIFIVWSQVDNERRADQPERKAA